MSHIISIELDLEVALHIQHYVRSKGKVDLEQKAAAAFAVAVDDAILMDDVEEDDLEDDEKQEELPNVLG